ALMKRLGIAPVQSCLVLLCGLHAGCSALTSWEQPQPQTPLLPATAPAEYAPEGQPAALRQVRFTVAAVGEPPVAATAAAPPSPALPFAGQTELSAEPLVGEVLVRNPTLAQMIAAWQAAQARYPQARALEDPMLNTRVGPAAFGSNKV